MKYVGVKHNPNDEKIWFFKVPKGLRDGVYIGAEVLCSTRKGHNFGEVVSIVEANSDEEKARFFGEGLPEKSIVAVAIDLDLNKIELPTGFLASQPSPEKIADRVRDLYDYGRFYTPVVFSEKNKLVDGYTAYLVAKMFGHKTLRGFYV